MSDGSAEQKSETTGTTPDAGATPAPRPGSKKFAGPTKTVLNRTWLIKVVVMTLVLIAFGSWGLYDAVVAYPNRGEGYASHAELEYLRAAQAADENEERGVFRRELDIPDPVAELAALRGREDELSNASPGRQLRAQMELRRLDWLTSLQRIGQLEPERTTFEFPRQRLTELEAKWTTQTPPSPLAFYDIPSQWLIMVVCYGFALHLTLLFVRVASKSYSWDPVDKRLTLPGGESLVPDDLTEVDKRKWDKFIVYLRVRDGHEKLGGQAIKVDTYRYALLEDWILDMEAAGPGTQETDDEPGDHEPEGGKTDDAGDATPEGDDARPAG
jgi:hypothetical protein